MSSTNFIVKELFSLPVDIEGNNDRIYRMTENFFGVYGDTFGKRVRLLRQDRKWSQVDLVQKLAEEGVKINNTWISQIENSDRTPSADVAIAMAKVFGTTTDFLFLLVDDPRPHLGDQEPEFFSPEADEAARIIDSLPPSWRGEVLDLVHDYDMAHEDVKRRVAAVSELLASLEKHGGAMSRQLVERFINAQTGNSPLRVETDTPPARHLPHKRKNVAQ